MDIDAGNLYLQGMRVAVRDTGDDKQVVEVRATVGVLGEPGVVTDAVAMTDPQPLRNLSASDFRDYVLTAVRSFVTHQVDEHLLVNGVRCTDPHPRDPNGFDARLPRPLRVCT